MADLQKTSGASLGKRHSVVRYAELIDSLLLHDERVVSAVRCTVGPFWVAILGVLARPLYIRDAILAVTDRRLIVVYTRGRFDTMRVDRAKARSAPLAVARRSATRMFRKRAACDVVWPNGSVSTLAFTRRNATTATALLAVVSQA